MTAVLELVGRYPDAAAPVPVLWDEVLAQVRAPQGAPGQHESTGAVRGTSS